MEKKIESTGRMDRGQTKAVSVRRRILTTPSAGVSEDTVMHLRNMGSNQAVQRLFESGVLQAKLTIGPPNDIYEQEADRVADEVMRMPDMSVIGCRSSADEVQRKPGWLLAQGPSLGDEEKLQGKLLPVQVMPLIQKNGEEEEVLQRQPEKEDEELQRQPEEEEEEIQAKGEAIDERPPPDFIENRVRTSGGGQALPENVRSFFEPYYGYDFSHVRVHADSGAAEMTKAINAQAFTCGRDIYFGAGKYNHENSTGKQLLAHELTHTIQQGATEKKETDK